MTVSLIKRPTVLLDARMALDMLDAAVELRGEGYVYHDHFIDCEYARPVFDEEGFEDEAWIASCIVGVGLHEKLGVTVEDLRGMMGSASNLLGFEFESHERGLMHVTEVTDLCESDLSPLNIEVTSDAARILQAAQLEQDDLYRGRTWGQARRRARAVARAIGALS